MVFLNFNLKIHNFDLTNEIIIIIIIIITLSTKSQSTVIVG